MSFVSVAVCLIIAIFVGSIVLGIWAGLKGLRKAKNIYSSVISPTSYAAGGTVRSSVPDTNRYGRSRRSRSYDNSSDTSSLVSSAAAGFVAGSLFDSGSSSSGSDGGSSYSGGDSGGGGSSGSSCGGSSSCGGGGGCGGGGD